MKKKSNIQFQIEMDENKVPEQITWQADDSASEGEKASKAIMLALWDQDENNTLRIDLWTKDMLVDEMKKFTCQNIITMADSFERSTGEKEIAEEMRKFGQDIAIRMGVLK